MVRQHVTRKRAAIPAADVAGQASTSATSSSMARTSTARARAARRAAIGSKFTATGQQQGGGQSCKPI